MCCLVDEELAYAAWCSGSVHHLIGCSGIHIEGISLLVGEGVTVNKNAVLGAGLMITEDVEEGAKI